MDKVCETGPTVYPLYPRRLDITFSSVISPAGDTTDEMTERRVSKSVRRAQSKLKFTFVS